MILSDIRVVELASGIAGPYAGLRLGDLGADVIKVEAGAGDWARLAAPRTPAGDSAMFAWLNRGKRSFGVPEAPEAWGIVLAELLRSADVVLCDLTDGVLERAGLKDALAAPDTLKPGLVVIRLSPFGGEGPLAGRAGSELVCQAMAGYPRYLGRHGEPPNRVGADVGGMGAGIFAVQAVLAALYHRMRSGEGQGVAVAELGALLALKSVHLAAQSDPDAWGGPRLGGANDPPEHGWRTADRPITFSFGGSVGAEGRPGWVTFIEEMGLDHLLEDPRFDKNGRNTTGLGKQARALKHEYEARFCELPSATILESVRRLGGIGAAYNTYRELVADPQTAATGFLGQADDGAPATRFPGRFSALETRLKGGVPRPGEHTAAIAGELGFSAGDVARMAGREMPAGRGM